MRYRKFWAALIGAGGTAALTMWGPDTTAGQVATVLVAVATAAAVYVVPNEPA